MKAIAAMSRNRVIGRAGTIPWHSPEELRWFRRATIGQAVLMGRRTFDSIGGRPLPERLNLIVTRRAESIEVPGVVTIREPAAFQPEEYAPREVWVIGGAEVYSLLLPRCTELYLSVLNREVEGDTFFPGFEDDFSLAEVVFSQREFEVRCYRRRPLAWE